MSKRQFKPQASSGRATSSTFGSVTAFGAGSSPLSYLAEPPELSRISDPNVAVAFKGLSKKDSTTKAKALEDIQANVVASAEIEEGVLDAWVCPHALFRILDSHQSAGASLSSNLHRHLSKSPTARAYSSGPSICVMWETNRETHV